MHIILTRASLLQQVQRCQNIVEKRSTNAILSNLLLSASEQQLEIIGTDLQMGISSKVSAQVQEEGKTTVSAKKLFDIIKELDVDADIELQTQDSFMDIKSGRSKFRLSTLVANDYPGIPEDDTDLSMTLEGQHLADMIAATSFAMSSDETRKFLTGTLFESGEHGLRLVATDGHRLSLSDIALDSSPTTCACIVPKKAVVEIRKISEEMNAPVTLSLGQRQIRLTAGDYQLTSKIIDAQFPVYSDVIPKGNPEEVLIDRVKTDQVLRRSMIVANEFTHDVKLLFSNQGVQVIAHNNEQEQSEEFIEAEYQGRDITIGFNARYIRDALGAMKSNRVQVQIKDELSPVLLLEEGSENNQYVVMPMRI